MTGDDMRDQLAGVLHAAGHPDWSPLADLLLPTVRGIVAGELRAAANEYETDGEIVSALADQARARFDLASEAAYAITASDFQHIVGRLRTRAQLVES